jgi:uncharacterized protein YbjT (DUF2867 family)
MRILVTGVTGYIGSRLLPRLSREGHDLRGFGRRSGGELAIPVVIGDAVTGAGLDKALDGVEVAYYLIHSMEPGSDLAFSDRERAAAENFAAASARARVARVIYLGGLVPESGTGAAGGAAGGAGGVLSPHLASRLAVENIVLAASPCSVAFRASIVIGARSRSFRFLVRLVERLPVLAVPAWREHRTRPVDERDVVELLARAATSELVCGQSLDIGGPDTVTYGELIDRISRHMLIARPTIGLGRLTVTPIASRIASLIAGESHELIGPLMESLGTDLLPRDDRAAELLGVRMHSLDAAIERALRNWEAEEPLAAR